MKPSLPAVLLACATAVGAAETPQAETPQAETLQFRGYAYDLASQRFLYTEVHRQRVAGERWLGGTIDYYAPDGTPLGHKSLDFSQDPYVPVYRMELHTARGRYMEGITAVLPDRIEMIKQGYGATKVSHASVAHRNPMCGDSGFHTFIRDHFNELMEGRVVSFRFAVAGNLDSFRFRARRIGEATFEGRPAVRIRVEPDSLLRWLVDPLELTYEPGQRRLVEYRGISNLHDPATGKAYNVRVVYPSARPADVPPVPGLPE